MYTAARPHPFSESVLFRVWPQTVEAPVLGLITGREVPERPHIRLQGREQDQRWGLHLGASFWPLRQPPRARPPGAEDPLASYLTRLELFKEGAESAQFTPLVTGNFSSLWGWQRWQTTATL